MNEKLKVGIIGFGKMGMLHAAIYNSLPQTKVVGVFDPKEFPALALSKYSDINYYSTINDLFSKEKLDIAAISSPVSFHKENLRTCIDNNVHIFIEKPLVCFAKEFDNDLEVFLNYNKKIMVGFNPRFIPAFRKAKEILEKKVIGETQLIRSNMFVTQNFSKGKGWRYSKNESGGGVLITLGSHLLYLLHWFFGKISRVNCNCKTFYSSEVEDFAQLMLGFDNGLNATMETSWSIRLHRKPEIEIEIHGSNGVLKVNQDTITLILDNEVKNFQKGETILRSPDLYESVPINIAGADYTTQATTFIDSIINNKIVEPSFKSAYHVQKVIEAAYKSWNNNANTVEIN